MTQIIACLDGVDPAYLDDVETPGWDAIAAEGTGGECECVVPSLTNVNNASIVTGAPPAVHGITGNTYYDAERSEHVYMNNASFLRTRTRLEAAADRGRRTAALFAKDKLRNLLGRGCDVAASAEEPPEWLETAVGPAPDIYSGAASEWILDAARHVCAERDPDVLYVSTTDVIPHKHPPDDRRAREWLTALDDTLAELHASADELAVTADHGMRHKSVCIDVEACLERDGVGGEVVRLIRDRHTYHHQNLGGAAYVCGADDGADLGQLAAVDGIDAVVPRASMHRFDLPADRVGDALVLGAPRTVFGPVEDGVRITVNLRSHGSHHERRVPYALTTDAEIHRNYELFAALGVDG